MKGRRLEIAQEDGHDRLPPPSEFEPGDYCGPISNYTGGTPAVFFKLPVDDAHPDAGLRHVIISRENHSLTEHDDGTITIAPSILAVRGRDYPGGPEPWHGYLEHGVWREC